MKRGTRRSAITHMASTETRAAFPYAHADRPRRPLPGAIFAEFPLSTAKISPFPSFGEEAKKSTFPRPSLGKAQCESTQPPLPKPLPTASDVILPANVSACHLYTAESPAAASRLLPAGEWRKVGDPPAVWSTRPVFLRPSTRRTAPWPAHARGKHGQVRAGKASRQCLNAPFAGQTRSHAKSATLCGMLVCRLMRRGSESPRHAHLNLAGLPEAAAGARRSSIAV